MRARQTAHPLGQAQGIDTEIAVINGGRFYRLLVGPRKLGQRWAYPSRSSCNAERSQRHSRWLPKGYEGDTEIHARGRGVLGERVPEAERHRRSPAGVAVACWINHLSSCFDGLGGAEHPSRTVYGPHGDVRV